MAYRGGGSGPKKKTLLGSPLIWDIIQKQPHLLLKLLSKLAL